jgi:hypothetical protein
LEALWTLAGINAGMLALIAWKEVQHAKLVRDLTAKLMARNLYEYATVAEDKPEREAKVKKDKLIDPVLGPDF